MIQPPARAAAPGVPRLRRLRPARRNQRDRTRPLEKVTVYLTAATSADLRRAAGRTGDTLTDTINKSVQFWAHVHDHAAAGGSLYQRDTGGGTLEPLQVS